MYLTRPDGPLPDECAFMVLFIQPKDKGTPPDNFIATARNGKAVTSHVDYGTEIFWVAFVDEDDHYELIMALSEDQLRDEIARRNQRRTDSAHA